MLFLTYLRWGDTMRRSFGPHGAAELSCTSKTGQTVFTLRSRTPSSERGGRSWGYNTGAPLSVPSSTPGPQAPGALGPRPRVADAAGLGSTRGVHFQHAPRGQGRCWPALRNSAPDPGDLEHVPCSDCTSAPRKLLEMHKFGSAPDFLNRNLYLRDPRVTRLHITVWGAPARDTRLFPTGVRPGTPG